MMLILIPAAGASSRMHGCDKLLEPVDGLPILAGRVAIALQTGALVLVTLPPDNPARMDVLDGFDDARLDTVAINDASEGMAASIRAGAVHARHQDVAAMMVLLPDMPEIESKDLTILMNSFDGTRIVRATDTTEQPGHPVIFPAQYFEALAKLKGDQGARALLLSEPMCNVTLPGQRATTDLDTPEEWAAWRQRTGR